MSAISAALEETQNYRNKMVAAHSRFFARKIHKIKKMLKPLFCRKPRAPTPPAAQPPASTEELDNALNEALEARLAEDLSSCQQTDAVQALVDGEATLVILHPREPFVPGHFSWTFLPSPDVDICPRGDLQPLSCSQTPEQQTPPASPR